MRLPYPASCDKRARPAEISYTEMHKMVMPLLEEWIQRPAGTLEHTATCAPPSLLKLQGIGVPPFGYHKGLPLPPF